MNRTALYDRHLHLVAKMTEFHGWEMPLYYTSILEEHACVRQGVGLFDISHMGQVWVQGPGAIDTLNELIVSDLTQVGENRACYTLLLNERGGIVDDVIVYRLAPQEFLVIVNCATRERDYAWFLAHRRGRVDMHDRSAGRSILAIQGPKAAALLEQVLGIPVSAVGRFSVTSLRALGEGAFVARTGYTGSDGFEVFLSNAHAVRLWDRLLEHGRALGVQPVGLGARDTLRLEAGLRLYGTDMDETTSPFEADLGWTVAIHKASFMGKEVLVQQKATGVSRRLIGFALQEGPVPRHGCAIVVGPRQVGLVTSGTFSPMLSKPIGLGYVETAFVDPGTDVAVAIRAKSYPAKVVKLPFWRAVQSRAVSVVS